MTILIHELNVLDSDDDVDVLLDEDKFDVIVEHPMMVDQKLVFLLHYVTIRPILASRWQILLEVEFSTIKPCNEFDKWDKVKDDVKNKNIVEHWL